MKINIKKWKDIKWKNIGQYFVKRINIGLFLVAFLVASYCINLWYRTIYKPEWSNLQKQNYIKSKDSETVFNKDKFEKIVNEYLEREQKRKKPSIAIKDIFQIKQ